MAKLKAPLLSLGASGQLGKTLVMSTWKGIKVAREYVVPANPRTPAQVIQRELMAEVVAIWQTYIVAPIMRTGWNLGATVNPKPLSGFNEYTGNVLSALVAGGTEEAGYWYTLWHGDTSRRLTPGATYEADLQPLFIVDGVTFVGLNEMTFTGFVYPDTPTQQIVIVSTVAGGYIRVSVKIGDENYWVSGIIPNPNPAV